MDAVTVTYDGMLRISHAAIKQNQLNHRALVEQRRNAKVPIMFRVAGLDALFPTTEGPMNDPTPEVTVEPTEVKTEHVPPLAHLSRTLREQTVTVKSTEVKTEHVRPLAHLSRTLREQTITPEMETTNPFVMDPEDFPTYVGSAPIPIGDGPALERKNYAEVVLSSDGPSD
jgi:hypothetical protein